MFSVNGVDETPLPRYVAANPTTYKDWGLNWDTQKGGKEDDLFSPYSKSRSRRRAPRGDPAGPEEHRRHLEHHHRLG